MFWMTLLSVVLGGVISAGSMIVVEWWRDRRHWSRRFEGAFIERRITAILNLKRLIGELEGALWPATINADRMEAPAPGQPEGTENPVTCVGKALGELTRCLATDGLLFGDRLEAACQRLAGAVQAYRRRFSMTKDSDFSVSQGIEATLPVLLADVDQAITNALPGCSVKPLPPGAFSAERMAGGETATKAMTSLSMKKSA